MKTQGEIQKAHDILVAIIVKEVPIDVKPEQRKLLKAATDVLCWVLEHDHNKAFGANLALIEQEAEKKGFVLTTRNN